MREVWKIVKIESLCDEIVDCLNRTAPKVDYATPYKMIRTSNVRHGRIDLEKVFYVNEATYKKWTRRLVPQKGDIILTREAPLGEIGMLKTDDKVFLGQRTVMYRANTDICDSRFIYYSLLAPFCQANIKAYGSGSTVEHMKVPDSKKIKLKLPPLPTQRKIASILSAYDDLIENNLKRIKLLEEQAQLTYEEWFVRMKFPGYETAVVDEETGLPEGWEEKKLVECCHLTMGQSPKSKFYNDQKNGLPFHQGVKDYGFRFPKNSSWSTEGKRIAEEGSILFSVRAPVGRLNIAIEKIILGRGLAAINHKEGWNSFLLYQLQNIFFRDNLMGGGSIFNSVTKRDVQEIKLIHANAELTKKFDLIASDIDDSIKLLTKQNQLLKEARDLLLPRLMMGMIDVEEIDVQTLQVTE